MHDKKNLLLLFRTGEKYIANLHTQPMRFREDFGKYRTQRVMNVIVTKSIAVYWDSNGTLTLLQ